MRIERQSGTLSGAVGVAGGGLAMAWPDQHWIGYPLMVVAVFIFVLDVRVERGRVEVGRGAVTKGWRRRVFGPEAVMVLGGAILVVGTIWYLLKPVISAETVPEKIDKAIGLNGFLPKVNYIAGTNVGGIKWKNGYYHVKLIITNISSEVYLDLDVIINPEKPIIAANSRSDFATCKIGPVERFPEPIVIGTNSSGKQFATPAEPSEDSVLIGPSYRLLCDKLPSHAQILVDMATVDPIFDVMSKHMWTQERLDPRYIDVHSSFTITGNRHTDSSRLDFAQSTSP